MRPRRIAVALLVLAVAVAAALVAAGAILVARRDVTRQRHAKGRTRSVSMNRIAKFVVVLLVLLAR